MQRHYRNLYKTPLFHCGHRLHKHAEKGTSAWHVLKYKRCYPEGCISFDWKCRELEQRGKCHRGKKHVGRDCFSCKFFYDEKNVFQPEIRPSQGSMEEFEKRFSEFEEWVSELEGRRIEVRGVVGRVMPYLLLRSNQAAHVRSGGVQLYFREGIFGYDRFDDPFYAILSTGVYDRSGVAAGDEIDFKAVLQIDRGRFVFRRVGGIEIIRSEQGDHIDSRELTQARFTGSIIEGQPLKCLRCIHGLLVDDNSSDGRSRPRRYMYCLKGVADYRYCPYRK